MGMGGDGKVTKIEKIEAELDRATSARAYVDRLIASLGDLREWYHHGEVIDHGKGAADQFNPPRCACGHPIRYAFVIHHPTRGTAWVGTECIGRIGELSPELAESLAATEEALRRKLREAKAQARRAAADTRAQEALDEYSRAYYRVREWCEPLLRERRVPYDLWYALFSRARYVKPPECCPPYSRAADRMRWARTQMERLRLALQASGLLWLIAR